jgi:Protein of unknown function (DUF3551)
LVADTEMEKTMRVIVSAGLLAAGILATTIAGTSAFAQSSASYPYCLMTGPAQECGYTSMAECLAAKRGNADFCEPNNTYVGGERGYSRPPQ